MDVPKLSISLALPPRDLFRPPSRLPAIKQMPDIDRTFWNPTLYNYTLDIRFPFTVAALYAAAVISVNRVNRRRKNQPWAFSKTKAFKVFVFAHNLLLVWFSAWAFLSTCKTLQKALPSMRERNFFVYATHNLCKPDGFQDVDASLGLAGGNLGDLDGGFCSMHEGYMFPGVNELWYISWVFYMSKFYEVVDTAIILARGKQSSTLQTYHHAGVMICAWTCIRFRAPPSLAGFLFNSAIHTIMYSYYALSSIRIRAPDSFKKALTTMQMAQFVIGFLLAMIYCFVRYDAPIGTADGCNHRRLNLPFNSSIDASTGPAVQQQKNSFSANEAYMSYHSISCLSRFEELFVIWIGGAYITPLFFMFAKFFSRTYKTDKTKLKEL